MRDQGSSATKWVYAVNGHYHLYQAVAGITDPMPSNPFELMIIYDKNAFPLEY